jgi:hypothetical protein
MTIDVYVGDVSEYLSVVALQADISAILITSKNYQNLAAGTYYTSIGDLDRLEQFGNILQQADNIFYVEPVKWSDSNMKTWTEEYLQSFFYANNKVIHGFCINESKDKSAILAQADTRKVKSAQLWVAGCSISIGIGVDATQRYGQLISNQLQMPVSFLSREASSLKWQADQILRSDIQKDDILIWGLTGIHRTPQWKNSVLRHYVPNYTKDPVVLEQLTSDHMIYDAVTSIHQVLNFCAKVDCKIILASLLAHGIEPYVHDCKNFIGLQNQFGRNSNDRFIDLGTDNLHPGPLMHQYYAQEIIKKYHNLYGENK